MQTEPKDPMSQELYAEIHEETGRVMMDVDELIQLFDGFPQPELKEMAKFSAYTLKKCKEKALAARPKGDA
jgi:hypothetical protein